MMSGPRASWKESFKQLGKFKLLDSHKRQLRALLSRNKEEKVKAIVEHLEKLDDKITKSEPASSIVFLEQEPEEKATAKPKSSAIKEPLLVDGYTQEGIKEFQKEQKIKGEQCAVSMFANEDRIGGNGWPHRGTQEESMLLFSDLRLHMPQGIHQKFRDYYYLPGETWGPGDRGFDKIGGGYGVRGATLFGNGKELWDKKDWQSFSAVFIAAPDLRFWQRNNLHYYQNADTYVQAMIHKIRAQYDLAIAAGATTLIAGGMGCGAFNNDPLLVSYLHMLVLQEDAYKDLNVQFYVPNDHFDNFKQFKFCFNHFAALREGEFGQRIDELADPNKKKEKEKESPAYSYQTLIKDCRNACKTQEEKANKEIIATIQKAIISEKDIKDMTFTDKKYPVILIISDQKNADFLKLSNSRDIIIEHDSDKNQISIKLTPKACREKTLTQLLEGTKFKTPAKSLQGSYSSSLRFFGVKSSSSKLSSAFQEFKNANDSKETAGSTPKQR